MTIRLAAVLRRILVAELAALLMLAGAWAGEIKRAEGQPPPDKAAAGEAQQYCLSIAPTAADARVAWESKQLADLSEQLTEKIAALEAKEAEYRSWVSKREAALKKARETLVAIYAHMQPEAASQQLSAMDDETAAAVLAQLAPRAASAILNEMEPGRAARLANIIAGGAPAADGKKS